MGMIHERPSKLLRRRRKYTAAGRDILVAQADSRRKIPGSCATRKRRQQAGQIAPRLASLTPTKLARVGHGRERELPI